MSLSFMMSSFWPSSLISVPAYFANSNHVIHCDIHRNAVAVVIAQTCARCQYLAPLWFFLGRLRQHQLPAGKGFLLLGRFDQQAVAQGTKIDTHWLLHS